MRINHNISSMITQGALRSTSVSMSRSLEKLSTGLRINSAADDAAGLGVSENLRKQVIGLTQALKNTQDVVSMLNIADGALNEQTVILQRMRELVIQAKNDTYTSTERAYMGTEWNGLMKELDRIAASTNFNKMQLFATPEARGLNTPGASNLYASDNNAASPVRVSDARFSWTDPANAPMGAIDASSANQFTMMIGANYEVNDVDNWVPAHNTYDPGASNLITIQFAQMDSNTLFSRYAGSDEFAGYQDGSNAFDGFSWNPDPGQDPDNVAFDREDTALSMVVAGATVQDKLDLALKLIDGGGAIDDNIDSNLYSADPNIRGVTGLQRVNKMRAHIGALTNRLEHSINNTMNQINNTQAAESMIRDADFASETAKFTRNQILTSSATAMLAQANVQSQGVLSLLGR